MRVRCRYAKTGKLRFVSAIDLGRLWERALRKARLPIAYSEGFSPHPKVSFPDALPLGYASTGEYAELTFAAPVDLDVAMAALDAAFPDGLRVLTAVEVADGAPRLSKWLGASLWELAYPPADGLADGLAAAAKSVAAAEALPVGRERKGETVEVDLRPALHTISTQGTTVAVVLLHVEPPVRPSEVHLALSDHYPTDAPHAAGPLPEPTLVTRVAQGAASGDGLAEALTGVPMPVDPRARTPERTTSP